MIAFCPCRRVKNVPTTRRGSRCPRARAGRRQAARRERDPEQHHGDRVTAYVSKRSAAMPAQSPTLSPTLSAITAGCAVVLRNARLDLADEVGAHIGGLGEDAAAEPREDGDERAAEGEPDEVVHGRLRGVVEPAGEDPVVAGDAEQAEADDEQAGDRACAEGDVGRRLDAAASRLGGARVRAHRDVHADEARRRREDRADEEPDRGPPPELVVEADHERGTTATIAIVVYRCAGTPRRPPARRARSASARCRRAA